ncbi:FAD-dependent oxidoreductase [Pseudomonas sp. R5(2019)]|uniref:FAD-dependent oxidoreductase n=1 Tax=Pseudomonas sp. R5(2019) TaxID=2697566 RepID=UPI001412E687|nr:FAD-dependent oxidoreductase [Pseudomonas sp. R5(2019)]NBA93944.1 FAD-dependent oxidoreductase [Pseudomonas sp. R5(2019)]
MKIGIIGAGWNGCHIALELAREGHQVVVLERNTDIFRGVSGDFGIRLHKGPHYPRSKATRDSCLAAFERFCRIYPELVVAHEASIYAHGTSDALGEPSKVTSDQFAAVCHESPECRALNLGTEGFTALESAFELEEPSVVLGRRLRNFFAGRLIQAGVEVRCNFQVLSNEVLDNGVRLHGADGQALAFDRVINASGYQALIPDSFPATLPVAMDVVYQVCLGLTYEDNMPAEKPLSFIVMDGWFPCLMPLIESDAAPARHYVLTHGSYTIMGSFDTPDEARAMLGQIEDGFVEGKVKPLCEAQMQRFWPVFDRRFSYTGWKGAVLAKLRTRTEFRSSPVFENANTIYVFPGKVSNVLAAADEVLALLQDRDCIEQQGFRYVREGVLASARQEIQSRAAVGERNTASLQTFEALQGH